MTQTLLGVRRGDVVRVYVNHEWKTANVDNATARYVVAAGRYFDRSTGFERRRSDGSQSFCRAVVAA